LIFAFTQTVHTFLAERGSEALLEDPLVPVATREILADGKQRPTVQREIKEKEKARDAVARKYCHANLSEDEIKHCMYSIGDNRCVCCPIPFLHSPALLNLARVDLDARKAPILLGNVLLPSAPVHSGERRAHVDAAGRASGHLLRLFDASLVVAQLNPHQRCVVGRCRAHTPGLKGERLAKRT